MATKVRIIFYIWLNFTDYLAFSLFLLTFAAVMNRIALLVVSFMASLMVCAQAIYDPKCVTMMDAPLEGADSAFIPALKSVGFVPVENDDEEEGTYHFTGDFYGIKDARLEVTVNDKTKLLSEATVTCGPYRTRELYERNQKYLLGKLQREWGNFKAKGDGSLYILTDYGYIRQSITLHENGAHSITYYYLNMAPYYKDVSNMGLKGFVQEVITENPVAENPIEHFDEMGKIESTELTDRKYNQVGYLISAAITDGGEKKLITYEYNDEGNLKRTIQTNTVSGLKLVTEYKWNDDGEMVQQSQKAFDKTNECIMSVTMKYDIQERDDNDNWTKTNLHITNWLKGQRAQTMEVVQTRTISYWDED